MNTRQIIGHGIWVGILATAVMDLLNRWVGNTGFIRVTDHKFLGRVSWEWLNGNFTNVSVFKLAPVQGETWLGVATHYLIGILVVIAFLWVTYAVTRRVVWKWWPVLFGLSTCVLPWFIFFPSIGLGFFGSQAPPQALVIRGSIFNHLFLGIGIMLGMFLLDKLLGFLGKNPFAGENRNEHLSLNRIPSMLLSLAMFQGVAMIAVTSMLMMGSILLVEFAKGDPWMAGFPVAIILVTSAITAYPMATLKDRVGYRTILLIATSVGVLGAFSAIIAASTSSVAVLFIACVFVGIANGTILLSRFAAAEMAPMQKRGKAVSIVMTGAMVGAISSPFLTSISGEIGAALSYDRAIGHFVLVGTLYFVSMIIAYTFFRNEPREIAQTANWKVPTSGAAAASLSESDAKRRLIFSIGSLLFGQMAMVFLMAATPAHMNHIHHSMAAISGVLTVHFLGMYGLSFLTGILTDRFGRVNVIISGGLLLAISCVIGMSFDSLAGLFLTLFLLGLGWNFCFLSGTVMVADSLKAGNMGRLQGATDGIVSFASAGASLASGFALSSGGFSSMAGIAIVMSLMPIILFPLLKHEKKLAVA